MIVEKNERKKIKYFLPTPSLLCWGRFRPWWAEKRWRRV